MSYILKVMNFIIFKNFSRFFQVSHGDNPILSYGIIPWANIFKTIVLKMPINVFPALTFQIVNCVNCLTIGVISQTIHTHVNTSIPREKF